MPLFQTAFWGGAPGGGEILLVLMAALLLFGSKRLPSLARSAGRLLESLRRTMSEVGDEIMYGDHDAPDDSPPAPVSSPSHPETSDAADQEERGDA